MRSRNALLQPPAAPLTDFVIDDATFRPKAVRKLTARIRKAQRELRRRIPPDAWDAYLEVEALTNKRTAKQLQLLFVRMLAVYAERL